MDSSFIHVQIDKNEASSSITSKQKRLIKKKKKARDRAFTKLGELRPMNK